MFRKLGNQSKPLVTIESEGEDKFTMKTESLVTTSIIKWASVTINTCAQHIWATFWDANILFRDDPGPSIKHRHWKIDYFHLCEVTCFSFKLGESFEEITGDGRKVKPILISSTFRGSGVEHNEHGGAEQDDAPDAGHRRRQGQRVHQGVPQGEDDQCLPGLWLGSKGFNPHLIFDLTNIFDACSIISRWRMWSPQESMPERSNIKRLGNICIFCEVE